MNRLLVSTTLFYPSKLGGPANTLFWLSKALVGAGVQVSVVTTDGHIEPGKVAVDERSDVEGVRVRYCKWGPVSLVKQICHCWKEMKDCDTVMLCDMFQRQVLPVAFMAKMRGKRIIWSPRGELFGPALEGSRMKRWYIALVRRCFGQYATFHATSEEERELIALHMGGQAKTVVLPNYIEMPRQMEREAVPQPYFLFVGRINAIKALDRLVLGLAQSELFRQSDYKLLLAGPNQNGYQQVLEGLIAENGLEGRVVFVGNVSGEEKFQFYANAHFSCLLSHSENFGNVVIEALSQGTPVIASKGTPWQSLNEQKAGYWIDNSPESIAACVDQILELPEAEYAALRTHALRLAESFDVAKNIGKWVEVI